MEHREFKDNVKTAAAYLAEHGVEVSHTRLLEALSRAFGERNWSTLSAQLKAGRAPELPQEEQADATWSPLDGPMNTATFVAEAGNLCPQCGSHNIEAHGIEADGPNAWDANECLSCGTTWNADYRLVGYSQVSIGTKAPTAASRPPAPQLQQFLAQLTERDAIVLCGMWDDKSAWLGAVYSAKAALTLLAENLKAANGAELLAAVAKDEDKALDLLIEAEVRFLHGVSKPDEESAREAAKNAADGYNFLRAPREDVVQELVDDVKERAARYGFSYSGWATAHRLACESNEVLDLDASQGELAEAATRLG